jgi:hypothetical protein
MKLGLSPVGQRYRSRDLELPEWLAAHDVLDLPCLEDSRYTSLRQTVAPAKAYSSTRA